jgi:hypothetical protein
VLQTVIVLVVVLIWHYDERNFIEASQDADNVQDIPFDQKLASYWCDDDHPDYVHSLPGYVPVVPPSCWYSGYLTYDFLGRTVHTHYTLQIAEFLRSNDENDVNSDSPLQKPLIYWSS